MEKWLCAFVFSAIIAKSIFGFHGNKMRNMIKTQSKDITRQTNMMCSPTHEELNDNNSDKYNNVSTNKMHIERSANGNISIGLGVLTKESIGLTGNMPRVPSGFNIPGMDNRYNNKTNPPPESKFSHEHMAMTYEKWLLLNELNSDKLGINTKLDRIKKNDHIFPESMEPDLTAGGLMSDWNEDFQKEKDSES